MAGQTNSGKASAFLTGALAGCGLAYFLNERCGRPRMMHLQDTAVHASRATRLKQDDIAFMLRNAGFHLAPPIRKAA